MFDFSFLAKEKGIIYLIDFFKMSGMEKFDYRIDKYLLTVYKVGDIIRIDIKNDNKN